VKPSRLGWNSRPTSASSPAQESSPERSTKQRSRASQSGLVEIFEHFNRTSRPLPAAHVDVGGSQASRARTGQQLNVRTSPLLPSRWRPSYGSSAWHISRVLDGSRRPPASGSEETWRPSSSPLAALQRAHKGGNSRTRRPAADLGDGFLMRAAALSQNGPRTSLIQSTSAQKVHEVGKITLDRLLIGTQPSVQATELVCGQPSWRPPSLLES
jgi:hypothetical protein